MNVCVESTLGSWLENAAVKNTVVMLHLSIYMQTSECLLTKVCVCFFPCYQCVMLFISPVLSQLGHIEGEPMRRGAFPVTFIHFIMDWRSKVNTGTDLGWKPPPPHVCWFVGRNHHVHHQACACATEESSVAAQCFGWTVWGLPWQHAHPSLRECYMTSYHCSLDQARKCSWGNCV